MSELIHCPNADFVICTCTDGVLVVGRHVLFHHAEPLLEVVNAYAQPSHGLAFLRTHASAKELAWFAAQQRGRVGMGVLGELAASSLPLTSLSLIQLLAVATAEAAAWLEARGREYRLDERLRCLRFCFLNILQETKKSGAAPALAPGTVTSCRCSGNFRGQAIFRRGDGRWEEGPIEELPASAVTVKASAEQMLWLSDMVTFVPVLNELQDRFGAAEVHLEFLLALEAALSIGALTDSVEGWLGSAEIFRQELERMILDGVTFSESWD